VKLFRVLPASLLALGLLGPLPGGSRQAEAGPILDWLFGRNRTTAYSIPGNYAGGYQGCGLFGDGGYAYNTARIPTVAVPCTNYQTVAQRVPVSTYRPGLGGGLFGCRGSEAQTARVPVGYQAYSPAVGLQQVGTVLVPAGGGGGCAPANPCAPMNPCATGLVAAQRPIAPLQTLRMPADAFGCSTCSGQPLAGGLNTVTLPVGPAPQAGYGGYGGMGTPSADVMPTLSGSPYGGMAASRPTLPGGWVPSGDPSTCSTCNAGPAMPAGPTNIAWQVAHIAVAQYGLCLFRIRGRAEADTELMPGPFRKMYGRGSVPSSDPAANAPIAVIRRTFDAVYEQAMKELPATDPATLAEPMDRPYAVYPNRLGCLLMAPVHEAIHAGQLGLIRRALGRDPLR